MIFIDIDGTLIDANDRPNASVVASVWKLLADGRHSVVVWSGGGEDYADQWARRLFFGHVGPWLSAHAKDPSTLRPGDVVVDDGLEFRVPKGAFLLTPDKFAEWALDDISLVHLVRGAEAVLEGGE